MNVKDVNLDEFINAKDDLSGADIKAMCTESGLLALRERRMRINQEDFRKVDNFHIMIRLRRRYSTSRRVTFLNSCICDKI